MGVGLGGIFTSSSNIDLPTIFPQTRVIEREKNYYVLYRVLKTDNFMRLPLMSLKVKGLVNTFYLTGFVGQFPYFK